MGMVLQVTVEDEDVKRGLANQRRAMGQDVKELSLSAAKRQVVPSARTLVSGGPGGIFRAGVDARSTTRGAYLTCSLRGRMRRAFGLVEFGGTVRSPIVPVNRQAIAFGDVVVARVSGPRTYRGRQGLSKAVVLRGGAFADQLERELTAVMQRRIVGARTFG